MIGVIDSGLGGLSVLREIHALMPWQSLTYIGDTAWCPYGTKTFEQIRERTFALTDFLLARGAEIIVIACNSATIVAIEALRANYPITFVGMEPGVKPAAALTRSGTIGVLATQASLAGEKFHQLVDQHAKNLRVITQPCPKFVELVEEGLIDGPDVQAAIAEYTDEMLTAQADVFILGCSHYPFLRDALERQLPAEVRFVDTGAAIARRVRDSLSSQPTDPSLQIFTTGDARKFQAICAKLLPELQAPCEHLVLP